jgi:hypothetical protein
LQECSRKNVVVNEKPTEEVGSIWLIDIEPTSKKANDLRVVSVCHEPPFVQIVGLLVHVPCHAVNSLVDEERKYGKFVPLKSSEWYGIHVWIQSPSIMSRVRTSTGWRVVIISREGLRLEQTEEGANIEGIGIDADIVYFCESKIKDSISRLIIWLRVQYRRFLCGWEIGKSVRGDGSHQVLDESRTGRRC